MAGRVGEGAFICCCSRPNSQLICCGANPAPPTAEAAVATCLLVPLSEGLIVTLFFLRPQCGVVRRLPECRQQGVQRKVIVSVKSIANGTLQHPGCELISQTVIQN